MLQGTKKCLFLPTEFINLKKKIMKKILSIVALVALVAVFATSCNKTCTCKTYAAGTLVNTEEDVKLEKDFKACSDMTHVIDMGLGKTGLECE